MKRTLPWSNNDESSSSHLDSECDSETGGGNSKGIISSSSSFVCLVVFMTLLIALKFDSLNVKVIYIFLVLKFADFV